MTTTEQESAAVWGPPSTETSKTRDEIYAEVYGDGDNPDDMDRMVQFTNPNKAFNVLSLPTAQLTKEQFDYLSASNPEGPHATDDEIQAFLDGQGLTAGEAIVTIDGIGARVIDTTVEDFGTTKRKLTDELLDLIKASGQEVADTFAIESSQEATVQEPNMQLGQELIADGVDGDAKVYTKAQLTEMRQARTLVEAAYQPVETTQAFETVVQVEPQPGTASERAPETKQEKYNALKKNMANLITENSISDIDAYYIEAYAKAGDARYNEQTEYITKMSPDVRSNTMLIQRFKDMYDEKEALMRG